MKSSMSDPRFVISVLGFVGVIYFGFIERPNIKQCFLKAHSEYLFQNGISAYRAGNLFQAERFWRESLSEQESDSYLTFQASESAINLGHTLSRLGKTEEAESMFKRALQIRGKHGSVGCMATSLYDLGCFYLCHGRLQEAEPLLKESLAIRTRIYGPNHDDTIDSQKIMIELAKSKQVEYRS